MESGKGLRLAIGLGFPAPSVGCGGPADSRAETDAGLVTDSTDAGVPGTAFDTDDIDLSYNEGSSPAVVQYTCDKNLQSCTCAGTTTSPSPPADGAPVVNSPFTDGFPSAVTASNTTPPTPYNCL